MRESVQEPHVNIVNTKAGILSLKDLQQQTNKKKKCGTLKGVGITLPLAGPWLQAGYRCQVDTEGLWYNTTTGRPVAPSGIQVTLPGIYHGPTHQPAVSMSSQFKTTWWGKGVLGTFRDWVKRCDMCTT